MKNCNLCNSSSSIQSCERSKMKLIQCTAICMKSEKVIGKALAQKIMSFKKRNDPVLHYPCGVVLCVLLISSKQG